MELRHLRYFCAVADWQGFNRAANALHVSQSAISEQILDLEREVGVQLLHRSPRRVRLTPAGEIFYEDARKVLALSEQAMEHARRSARGEIGALKTAFLVWGASPFLPRVIREFRQLHPGVRLSLMEMHPSAQSEALLQGSLDVGFTRPLQPPYAAQLRSETLYADPLIAVLPSDHPLARGPLALRELANESFVLCERDISPALFDRITSLCEQAGFSPRIIQTSNVLSSVLALVEAGEGVTLIPSSLRKVRFSDLAFCPLTEPQGAIELVMAWSPEREGAVKTAFLDFVRARKEIIRGSLRSRKSGKG
ncbi:MAG TPA: LysR substrate-binding domain-containing protein [Acidobacteriaceae bacterium]|jgi:DNA-binding transcriptional LysR family regulator|nr:LysR substrate-binding domain-containing protein [Acidobacteriaceae bacterium]